MPNKKKNQEPIEIKADMKALLEVEQYGGIDGITNRLSLGSYVEEVMPDGCFLVKMPVHKGNNYLLPRSPCMSNALADGIVVDKPYNPQYSAYSNKKGVNTMGILQQMLAEEESTGYTQSTDFAQSADFAHDTGITQNTDNEQRQIHGEVVNI